MSSSTVARPVPPRRTPRTIVGTARRRPDRRVRRIALIASLLCLVPAFASYVRAIAQPSNSSLGIRTVEWMRDNGARGLVNRVESIYYSLNAPAKGGPALRTAPVSSPGSRSIRRPSTVSAARRYYRPPRVRPVLSPALPGEGVWRATFARGGRKAPRSDHELPPGPLVPANGRRRRLDRPHADDHLAVSRPARAERVVALARARWRCRRSSAPGWWRRSTAASSSRTPAVDSPMADTPTRR